MKRYLVLLFSLLIFLQSCAQVETPIDSKTITLDTILYRYTPPIELIKGADVSWVTEMEKAGISFYNAQGVKKDCFILIVKIDTSAYQYPLLKNYTYSFNELTEERRCPTNIPSLINDISNCIKFEIVLNDYYVPFSNEQQLNNSKKRFPKLPEVNRYVKIQYDPIENGIALVTNPNGVNLIPSFHDADEQPRLKGILKWMDSDSIEIPTF
jgi:hypothetical protein